MPSPRESLIGIAAEELSRPAAPDARRITDEIVRRHGSNVVAVLFYGSCLRKDVYDDAVLDFYVIVDSYRGAYRSRSLAWVNSILPPNVFFITVDDGGRTLRAKYAVMSAGDFSYSATSRAQHSIVWARFCQPAVLTHARDERARMAIARAVTECVVTMVETMLALMTTRADDGSWEVLAEELWQFGLSRTYGTELRPESAETIASIYAADADRYDRVTVCALDELATRGVVELAVLDRTTRVSLCETRREQIARSWRRRMRAAKLVYGVRLVKTSFTFGEWLPYALWKLERHTGVTVELSPRQRRHPLIFGWPVIIRLLWSGRLR